MPVPEQHNEDRKPLLALLEEASRLANTLDLRLPNGGKVAVVLAAMIQDLRDVN